MCYTGDNKISAHKNKLKEPECSVEIPEKSIKIGQGQDWTKGERLKYQLEFKLDRSKNFLNEILRICIYVCE